MNAPGNESMEHHDLRTRVVSLEHQFTSTHQRVNDLEKWQRQTEIADARMDVKFLEMDGKLTKIDMTLSRIMWLVLGGIIMGAIGFMLKGGFTLPH
ncbi:hypothetical protein [Rhizobium leguminosarum]|uniref:hypothetical protein n=1 Tax=Rhizobium leguminosarum TaxID=384 RepID=UPI001FDED422|nr:hypothetical protein [Rhizobium leguminosarum]